MIVGPLWAHFAFAGPTGGTQIAPMVGWIGDLGRLYWGLLYWNTRKSLFRLRGASGPAPCQHPSDSGAAGQTGCEACAGWRSKDRFLRLCPLLRQANGRRMCSVAAADVRPFWGRAAAAIVVSAAVLACCAVFLAFAGFRAVGYRVPLRVVAWPPAWHQIGQARADYYYQLAVRSFNSGDIRQSYMALNQAYALDPHNFTSDRLLAQLAQIGSPDFSDTIYSRLLLEDKAHFEETGEMWMRALIARGDFPSVGGLAARMLRGQASHVPAWVQALLFAEGMTGDTRSSERLLAGKDPIPEGARSSLLLARSVRACSPDERATVIRLRLDGAPSHFEVFYLLNQLIELGRASEVAAYVEGPGGQSLDSYDSEALKMDAYASLGWGLLVRREIGSLVERGPSAAVVALVAAHLVRHPDAENAEFFFQQLDLHPMPATAGYSGARRALLCVAGINGLDARLRQQGEAEARIVAGGFPVWQRIKDFFEGSGRGGNPASILPTLGPVPLDTMYAVFDHYRALNPNAWQNSKPRAPGG